MILGVITDRGKRLFSSPNHPDWFWDPPSLSMGTWVLPLEVKQPWHKIGHSPPSWAEGKSKWICMSSPLHTFMAVSGTSFSVLQLKGLHKLKDIYKFNV